MRVQVFDPVTLPVAKVELDHPHAAVGHCGPVRSPLKQVFMTGCADLQTSVPKTSRLVWLFFSQGRHVMKHHARAALYSM